MLSSGDNGNGGGYGGGYDGGEEPLDDRDRAALELALKCCKARGAAHAQRIDELLAERSRVDVALSASYSCQMASLRLKPWEMAPCDAEAGDGSAAAKLQRRMRRHGVSKYHPSPMDAIDRAQAADRRPRVTPFAVKLFKMSRAGHDVRAELHAELGLTHQPNVLDIDVLAEPPAALMGIELEDWKLAQRLLGQLIVGE
jgi:hypothetical protein